MERGITHSMGSQGMKKLRGDTPSTNIPTESNPSGGQRNQNDPTSYPSGAEIPDTPSKPDTPSIKIDPLKIPKPKASKEVVKSSYDPSVAQALEALKEADVQGKFMPSNPDFKGVGALKDKSKIQKRDTISLVAQDKSKHMTGLSKDDTKNVADFIKKDVPYQDSKGGHTLELK